MDNEVNLGEMANALAEQGYCITDRFMNGQEVDSILLSQLFQHAHINFRKAGIGKTNQHQVNEEIRNDYIQWLDPDDCEDPVKLYFSKVNLLIHFFNKELFLSLKDSEIHAAIYPAGSYYKRHLDQFKKDDHRKISIVLYLNKEWEEKDGGQLRIFLPDGFIDIPPLAGRLVCFRSDLVEHEVLPSNCNRLSITGWLLDQRSELRMLW